MTDAARGDRTGRNAVALAEGLVQLGLQCAVEARAGLALLLPEGDSAARLAEPEIRRAALALARECGFTHVAIELPNERRRGPATNAPLSRD